MRVQTGRILSLGGENDPPSPPLKKGGTGSEVPLCQGGFRGIELELEATPNPEIRPFKPSRTALS